jgi:hypothetical protein
MQASLCAAMLQPSENATDGSSVSRLAPRMTVDVDFGDIAVDSDVGSNQGTPGRPLHHFHSISPSTASCEITIWFDAASFCKLFERFMEVSF